MTELFDSLADETSKRALFHYVESCVRNCVYRGEQNPTTWRYFFGGKHERLYIDASDSQSICTDYVWYMRKYTPYLLSVKKVHELVFYAVPKERALR